MTKHHRSRMHLFTPMLVGLAGLAVIALSACQTDESARIDTSGPPPEGYETWDDYFEARDELIKDQERQMQQELQGDPMPHSAGGG